MVKEGERKRYVEGGGGYSSQRSKKEKHQGDEHETLLSIPDSFHYSIVIPKFNKRV